jgi:fumarylacetoacetase
MRPVLDETHDSKAQSWVESANDAGSDFPIQNLPFGIFWRRNTGAEARVGVAIGDRILDLDGMQSEGLLTEESVRLAANACAHDSLNPLMALGGEPRRALRRRLHGVLRQDASASDRQAVARHLVEQADVDMLLPTVVGDYTDFYASIFHATNVGKLFRPDHPLLPNYKYIPIGYHGRASSLVPSGTPVRRPSGQAREGDADPNRAPNNDPKFGPTGALDYEVELGFLVGAGNRLGETIPIEEAEEHIFGICLVNDWSAREIQAWEYQPLGPFLGKSFATSLSPWVVTMDALAPFRTTGFARAEGDPAPLPYLFDQSDRENGGLDLWLEVSLLSARMREAGIDPVVLGRSNFRDMYWTMAQMLTHHASNGARMPVGAHLAGQGSGHAADWRAAEISRRWRRSHPPGLLRARGIPPHRVGHLPGDDSARVSDLTRPRSPLPSTTSALFCCGDPIERRLHRGKKERT